MPNNETPNTKPRPGEHPRPDDGWNCFHCGQTFYTREAAREHFGEPPNAVVACRIKAGREENLVKALRRAEAHNHALRDAIAFASGCDVDESLDFLRCWGEGAWDEVRRNWPYFDLTSTLRAEELEAAQLLEEVA